jgi:hypothetical protein
MASIIGAFAGVRRFGSNVDFACKTMGMMWWCEVQLSFFFFGDNAILGKSYVIAWYGRGMQVAALQLGSLEHVVWPYAAYEQGRRAEAETKRNQN